MQTRNDAFGTQSRCQKENGPAFDRPVSASSSNHGEGSLLSPSVASFVQTSCRRHDGSACFRECGGESASLCVLSKHCANYKLLKRRYKSRERSGFSRREP